MEEALEAEIAKLQAAGDVVAAAELLRSEGEFERAAALLASVWKFQDAIALAEADGALETAYRYAVVGSLETERVRLRELLRDAPMQASAAARLAREAGLVRDAALLHEASGEPDEAAAIYEELGAYSDAARLRESRGDHRQAGVLYERALEVDPEDAVAGLALAKILAHFGRYEAAVERLQQIEEHSANQAEVLLWLIACLDALDWPVAAAERMADLRRHGGARDDETVAEFLARSFGSAEGLKAHGGDPQHELLAGRYRLDVLLGAGIAGRVFLAHDCILERPVAIKVLSIPEGPLGRDAHKRFQREANIASAIEHPSIVRMLDYNASGPFLVMEYMEGGALEERLLQQNVSPEFVRSVCLSVLDGLAEVHRRGVIHRDLKPANILLGVGGECKISDFGVSHLLDLGATVTGALFGTLGYMAPEQLEATQHPTAATDLYAFGVILFRMLTGAMPFEGTNLLAQKLNATAPLPSSAHASLHVFDEISEGLLRSNPDERLSNPHEVASMLRAIEWPRKLPWEHREAPVSGRRSSEHPTPPDAGGERYEAISDGGQGPRLAVDRLLERNVELRKVAQHRGHLEPFAALACPELQMIYAIPEDLAELVLEWPAGTRMSELPDDSRLRARVADALLPLVERFSQSGITHGELTPGNIVIGADRVVLLLPVAPPKPEADDQRQLEALRAGVQAPE